MLTVTDKASEVIKDFLKDKSVDAAIRITMSIG
jgi:Fe-S cluster assembly iron-binding protein IscA